LAFFLRRIFGKGFDERVEAGAVHLPTQAHWLEEFKKELLAFPASKHDDQIDALSQALQRTSIPEPPVAVFGTFHTAR
jgi:predicted phage terminase large subunit-like protein